MSLKLKSSSGSGSDTHEGIEDSSTDNTTMNTRRRKKLGAHFFPDENSPTTTTSRPKTPPGHSCLKKTWTMPSTRSRAALWPSDTTDPEDSDKNNNASRPLSAFPRAETSGNYEGAQAAHSDELAIVTEQLQIIQETQELILSELRSDIESLQTENLCLQHNNSRLRIQVDHLNELVYELSKELNLMREFVNARKGQVSESSSAHTAEHIANEQVIRIARSARCDNRKNTSNGPSQKKSVKKSKELLTDDKDSVKTSSSRSRSSHKDKAASTSKKPKEKKDDEKKPKTPKNSGNKRFGFISKIFRPRTPRSPTPSSRGSRSEQE